MTADGKVSCLSCGKELPQGARYCGFDGIPLPGSTEFWEEKMCPKCNRKYPDYASYCTADATRLIPSIHDAEGPVPSAPTSQWAAPPAPAASSAASSQTRGTRTVDTELGELNPAITIGLMGKVIDGKYKVESMIGEGGMAVVYKANHMQMERTVVIKVMQETLLVNKTSIERFERECKLTAKLNHPNIVSVYDVGRINDVQPYLVMEYIKGESLADKISRQGAMPITTAANIIVQICRGLQEAHSQGIIHRDLKPENVLLQEKTDRPDWVKIVDFGISHLLQGPKRLTKTGKMIGTPEYIAPEQLKDRAIDVRTDIYSLGIMMYELLAGRVPFESESAESVLMKHLMVEPAPLSTYRDDIAENSHLHTIVHKCLNKNPDERYQSVTELRLDVEQVLNSAMFKRN